MLCNMFLYVVQHIFRISLRVRLRALCADSCRSLPKAQITIGLTKNAQSAYIPEYLHKMQKSAERPQIARAEPMAIKEKMSRHRRYGERVALRHYLARAAMERTAHRIPGTYYQREQICTAVLRAAKENARGSHESRAS